MDPLPCRCASDSLYLHVTSVCVCDATVVLRLHCALTSLQIYLIIHSRLKSVFVQFPKFSTDPTELTISRKVASSSHDQRRLNSCKSCFYLLFIPRLATPSNFTTERSLIMPSARAHAKCTRAVEHKTVSTVEYDGYTFQAQRLCFHM